MVQSASGSVLGIRHTYGSLPDPVTWSQIKKPPSLYLWLAASSQYSTLQKMKPDFLFLRPDLWCTLCSFHVSHHDPARRPQQPSVPYTLASSFVSCKASHPIKRKGPSC